MENKLNYLSQVGGESRRKSQSEYGKKYFQWSRRRTRRNKRGDSDSAKWGQRGVMRKLRVITGKPRVQFLQDHMLCFYSQCNHLVFSTLGYCILSAVQDSE